uniref:Fucosyltransferase n=1 Tax=Lutzomyia longipalpis TaxID=7200 RepID=A0A1B0EUU0_LUTLO
MYILTPQQNSLEQSVEKVKPIFILLYETPTWMQRLKVLGVSDCVVTADKNYLPDIEQFDALVFSGSDNWAAEEVFPKKRSPHQYYVFADLESPFYTMHKFSMNPLEEIYNLTMTYRRDSDIYWPYGFITDQKIQYVDDLQAPKWKSPVFDDNASNIALERVKTKTRLAAWFVSNCKPASKRHNLVKVLQKHIGIDVYGKCGNFTCDIKDSNHCYEMVEEKYFFYFSFENSLCKDYLTEKVFNVMKYNVVPVVYGGANYSHHLPPHSYIDANDFATATELANYLKYLASNPHEYVKYFWWKTHYRTVSTVKSYSNLCKKLHEYITESRMGQFTRTYRDINSWFNVGQCTQPRIKMN